VICFEIKKGDDMIYRTKLKDGLLSRIEGESMVRWYGVGRPTSFFSHFDTILNVSDQVYESRCEDFEPGVLFLSYVDIPGGHECKMCSADEFVEHCKRLKPIDCRKKIYQTEMTREVLEKIEEVSNVKWNAGELPTEYWDECRKEQDPYLNISAEQFSDGCMMVGPMSLYCGGLKVDRTLCTAEEFVDHCKQMLKKCV
jgi:hypothetical protein